MAAAGGAAAAVLRVTAIQVEVIGARGNETAAGADAERLSWTATVLHTP